MRFLLSIALLLTGCTGDGSDGTDKKKGDPCEPGDEPTLEVGTGEVEFLSLAETDHTFDLVHGSQGGFHVLIGLQATYLDASNLFSATVTGTIGGEVKAVSEPWIQMRCNGPEGALQSWGTYLIYAAQPEDLHMQATHIEVTLTDIAGTTVTASADATIFDDTL
jgi:hypothetical protein